MNNELKNLKSRGKVAVGLSGGVDSSVAALLLKQQGYEVLGIHLHFWSEENYTGSKRIENKCCSIEALEMARKVASILQIPFYTLDLSAQFKKEVVDYFLEEYSVCRTPNPCVVCNQRIKFGAFLEYAKKLGCDFLATGHYARITAGPAAASIPYARAVSDEAEILSYTGSLLAASPAVYHLLQGVDQSKDQSYFLHTLNQEQLGHILFPIGDYRKDQVREMARKNGLPTYNKPESFEVCFVSGNNYRDFLKRQIPETIKKGEVVNIEGEVIGVHRGLPFYTIGQRHGFEINVRSSDSQVQLSHLRPKSKFLKNSSLNDFFGFQNPARRDLSFLNNVLAREGNTQKLERLVPSTYIAPLYVLGFKPEKNQLVVGRGRDSESQEFAVENVCWVAGKEPVLPLNCQVRIRYQGRFLSSKIKVQRSKIIVELDEAERGVTPGQSAVFYQNGEILGGGIIS